ncbi:MAG: hypothetical protein KA340_09230 [Saprospiraceae bacterium]|nr:hypothetical protein [Saprospiraceae bacterium]
MLRSLHQLRWHRDRYSVPGSQHQCPGIGTGAPFPDAPYPDAPYQDAPYPDPNTSVLA